MKTREKRKIVRTVGNLNLLYREYVSLKPCRFGENVEWESFGRRYSIKGINSLVRGNGFEFVIDSEVEEDLRNYRKMIVERKRQYTQ